MNVAVFGAGHVGLVTSVCLAEVGHSVVCVDVDRAKIESIRAGTPPFFEPGLAELLLRGRATGRLRATSSVAEAMEGSEVSIIAVGTPDRDGRIDLVYVLEAAGIIGERIRDFGTFHTVIVKSTVVPGTTTGPVRELLECRSGRRAGVDFGLGMNPEFLREGSAVRDFLCPDRVVLGALEGRTAEVMQRLYALQECPKLTVHPTEAELIKYAANALFSTLISFSNEMFNLCEAIAGVDGSTVLKGALLDHRWTPRIDGKLLAPGVQDYVTGGVGYGGSCFPKDMNAITSMARDLGCRAPLLEAVVEVNRRRPVVVVERLKRETGGLKRRKVAVLGMAFKPGTDDWRNSPSLPLIGALLEEGSSVAAWDPMTGAEAVHGWKGRVSLSRDPGEVLESAHIAIIATAWPEIARWPWDDLGQSMAQPVVYDGRNLMAGFAWPTGFRYIPAGSGKKTGETR